MSAKRATIGGDTTEGQTTVRQNGRLYHTPSFSDDGIGFRLAHDGLFTRHIVRGSSPLNFARDAGKPISDWNTAYNRFSGVGFRLAFDRETT